MPPVDVKDLQLKKKHYTLCGNTFREFCITFCSHRQRLVLKHGDVSWDTLGLEDPGVPLRFGDWATLLQGVPFVLALPDFKKHGNYLTKRLSVLETKGSSPAWASYLTMLHHDILDKALLEPDARLVDLVNDVRSNNSQVFDRSFVRGNVREGHADVLGYNPGLQFTLRGSTKKELQHQMMQLDGVGAFHTQHGTILLCKGKASLLQRLGVSEVQESAVIGSGVHGILQLLFQETIGFRVSGSLASFSEEDWSKVLLQERDRWRRAAMKVFNNDESMVPLPLQKQAGKYIYLPECFGDLLCECRQMLRCLLGLTSPRTPRGDDWTNEEVQPRKRKRGDNSDVPTLQQKTNGLQICTLKHRLLINDKYI